jgi:hypothetical protein
MERDRLRHLLIPRIVDAMASVSGIPSEVFRFMARPSLKFDEIAALRLPEVEERLAQAPALLGVTRAFPAPAM